MSEIISKSAFMYPLLLCSFIALAVIIHRAISLRCSQVIPNSLVRALQNPTNMNELAPAIESHPSTLGSIAKAAFLDQHPNRQAAAESTEAKARDDISQLQSGLTALEIIITIAPLLGLLGTVSGLVTVFSGLGGTEVGSPSSPSTSNIARGIAEALNTTIAGLVVAVPTVIAHGYFQRKVERFGVRMESIMQEALRKAYR